MRQGRDEKCREGEVSPSTPLEFLRPCMLSRFRHVWLCATPWTVPRQAPLSLGFSRREYWSGLPFSSPEDLPNPGIELASLISPELQASPLSLSTWETLVAGLIMKLTQDRLTGEKETLNSCTWQSHKMGPKTWPKQATFILIRQRDNAFVRNWQDEET